MGLWENPVVIAAIVTAAVALITQSVVTIAVQVRQWLEAKAARAFEREQASSRREFEAAQAEYQALMQLVPAMADFAARDAGNKELDRMEEVFLAARVQVPFLAEDLRERVYECIRDLEEIRRDAVALHGAWRACAHLSRQINLQEAFGRPGRRPTDEQRRALAEQQMVFAAKYPQGEEPILARLELWREQVTSLFLGRPAPETAEPPNLPTARVRVASEVADAPTERALERERVDAAASKAHRN
ncbi:MAG: hypothetical protein RLO52_20945 [Sandaracinaceae bacterium]